LNKALLDTDILSESLKGIDPYVISRATAYLIEFRCYTLSIITVIEVIKGWHKKRRDEQIQRFLTQLGVAEVLTLDVSTAEIAGRISADLERIGQPIGLADATIAATALRHSLVLVTGNQSHYQRIQALGYDLMLDNWRMS